LLCAYVSDPGPPGPFAHHCGIVLRGGVQDGRANEVTAEFAIKCDTIGEEKACRVPSPTLLTVMFAFAQPLAAKQSNPPRLIESTRGTPIAEKLRPGDESVVVKRGNVISTFVDDRVLGVQQDLDERAEFADAIAVVEPGETNSYLTENGEWIQSKLDLRLVHSLKTPVPPIFDRDGHATVEHSGGELRIKGVLVRVTGYYLLKPGERYLVFLKAHPRATTVGFIGMQLRITPDDHIAPIHLDSGREATAPSALYGMTLKQIEDEFSRRMKR